VGFSYASIPYPINTQIKVPINASSDAFVHLELKISAAAFNAFPIFKYQKHIVMKRPKILLNLIAGILAIGALAASKAKFHNAIAFVYTQCNNQGNCVFYGRVSATITPTAGATLVTFSCPNILFKNNNCTQALYVGN